jgi:hypothetical protein
MELTGRQEGEAGFGVPGLPVGGDAAAGRRRRHAHSPRHQERRRQAPGGEWGTERVATKAWTFQSQ